MKNMMKKTLSVIIALAMLLVPMTVFATDDIGTDTNPYQLSTTSGKGFAVNVAAGETAFVQVDDCNGSVVNVTYATSTNYIIMYCKQPYYAETETGNNTTTVTMVNGADMFSVYNSGSEAVSVYMTLTAGAGAPTAGTWENPEEVTLEANMFGGVSAFEEVALEAGNEGYWFTCTAPSDGLLTVSVDAVDTEYNSIGWMYNVDNSTRGTYGDSHYSDEETPVYYEKIKVSEGDEIVVFASTYDPSNKWYSPAGTVIVDFSFESVGSVYYPEVLDETGSYGSYITAGSEGYYYIWTAAEDGTVTVTMNDKSDWQYSVNVEPASEDADWYYGDYHFFNDNLVVASESVEVNAGDIVTVYICTYDPADKWNSPAGTINWTLDFVGGSAGGEDEVNYFNSGEYLVVGDNNVDVNNDYEYTLYAFKPTEEGEYTFASDNSVMGIVSRNGLWVQTEPSTDTVNENEFVWECDGVGQSIWVAVKTNNSSADIITITRAELDKSDEIQRIVYENTVTPEDFNYEGDAEKLVYVDVEDDVDDRENIYYNEEDGYYHYGAEDGPVVYVNLDDSLMSMVQVVSYGKLVAVNYDVNGEAVLLDCTEAMLEYIACADVVEIADGTLILYPLTEDLAFMYKYCGKYMGWYGEDGWMGLDADDAWMFACYYEFDEANNNNNNNNNNSNNTTDVENPKIPDTDNEAFGIAFAMMVAAVALGATVVTTKKSKRVK